jgi:predicted nucleic acid-binding protein
MSRVVIDANLALALALPLEYSGRVVELAEGWHRASVRFAAPALWSYEVVSALRKAVVAKILSQDEAGAALSNLWALDVEQLAPTLDRQRQALVWARRLNQAAAYDAQYMVVADELGVPFWTADRRLSQAAAAAGADWVQWIGDSASH